MTQYLSMNKPPGQIQYMYKNKGWPTIGLWQVRLAIFVMYNATQIADTGMITCTNISYSQEDHGRKLMYRWHVIILVLVVSKCKLKYDTFMTRLGSQDTGQLGACIVWRWVDSLYRIITCLVSLHVHAPLDTLKIELTPRRYYVNQRFYDSRAKISNGDQ